jgi:hypothetical protein
LEEEIQKCKENDLSFEILEWKMDIDTLDDLKKEASIDESWFYKNIIKIIDEK